jgi:hypothetical protein
MEHPYLAQKGYLDYFPDQWLGLGCQWSNHFFRILYISSYFSNPLHDPYMSLCFSSQFDLFCIKLAPGMWWGIIILHKKVTMMALLINGLDGVVNLGTTFFRIFYISSYFSNPVHDPYMSLFFTSQFGLYCIQLAPGI